MQRRAVFALDECSEVTHRWRGFTLAPQAEVQHHALLARQYTPSDEELVAKPQLLPKDFDKNPGDRAGFLKMTSRHVASSDAFMI